MFGARNHFEPGIRNSALEFVDARLIDEWAGATFDEHQVLADRTQRIPHGRGVELHYSTVGENVVVSPDPLSVRQLFGIVAHTPRKLGARAPRRESQRSVDH